MGKGKHGKLKEEGWLWDLLEVFGARTLCCLKERAHGWCRKTGQGRSSQGHHNLSWNEILSYPARSPCPELQYLVTGAARGERALSTIQGIAAASPGLLHSHTKSPSSFSSSSHTSTAVCQVLVWNICPQEHFVFFKLPFLFQMANPLFCESP